MNPLAEWTWRSYNEVTTRALCSLVRQNFCKNSTKLRTKSINGQINVGFICLANLAGAPAACQSSSPIAHNELSNWNALNKRRGMFFELIVLHWFLGFLRPHWELLNELVPATCELHFSTMASSLIHRDEFHLLTNVRNAGRRRFQCTAVLVQKRWTSVNHHWALHSSRTVCTRIVPLKSFIPPQFPDSVQLVSMLLCLFFLWFTVLLSLVLRATGLLCSVVGTCQQASVFATMWSFCRSWPESRNGKRAL